MKSLLQCRLRAALVFAFCATPSIAIADPPTGDHPFHSAQQYLPPANVAPGPVFIPIQNIQGAPAARTPGTAPTVVPSPLSPPTDDKAGTVAQQQAPRPGPPRPIPQDGAPGQGPGQPPGTGPGSGPGFRPSPPPPGGPGGGPGPAPTSTPQPVGGQGGCEPHSPLPAASELPPFSRRAGDIVAYQQFPPTGPRQTAWLVTSNYGGKKAFFITEAWFLPGPKRNWVKVLDETGPSEIFVPYQNNAERFSDLLLLQLQVEPLIDAIRGRCGQFLDRPNVKGGTRVVREITEKGLLWMAPTLVPGPKIEFRGHNVYRGHKLTLWAVVNAWNYRYVLSYAFHDDGSIELRGGATGTNFPRLEKIAHTHNFIWRINMRITEQPRGGATNVNLMRHISDGQIKRPLDINWPNIRETWQDRMEPFNGGREGSDVLNPLEFTAVHVQSTTLANRHKSASGYMIMPFYRGLPRHREPFLRKDLWVTKHKDPAATRGFPEDDVRCLENIEGYLQKTAGRIAEGLPCREPYINNESIQNTESTIWLLSTLLHTFRDEDGYFTPQRTFWGTASTMWTGVDLKPHNLFDGAPLYPEPPAVGPPRQPPR